MNNIFQKNISALAIKNLDLANRLLKHIPTDVPQLVQENGTYNLLYKGKLIHNQQSPLGEAQEIFSMAKNEPVSIHIVYGLGLGYLFQVASLNSQGAVVLYEPDLNILWLTFTLVDFSNDILKKNVFIADNFETVAQAVYMNSATQNTPELLSVSSQRSYNPQVFDDLVRKLLDMVGSYALDRKYTQERFYSAVVMMFANMHSMVKETPLAHLKDVYRGKTAVIVSAGPTLDRNIETLKKNRDKYILFTVGTAAKTLIKNGLKPDFICLIETFNASKQLSNIDLSDINLITEPYSHYLLRRNFKFKNIYNHISSNAPTNEVWRDIFGENIDEYITKGTVSYTALNSARILGCSKIILVGQDLAYVDGQCYSKDSAYKELVCKYNQQLGKCEVTAKDIDSYANSLSASEDVEVRRKIALRRLENLNKSLYTVKGISGEMIPTESVYAAFVNPLQEFVKHFNDREYVNTSLVGAQIDGFKNMSLEEALETSNPVGDIELKYNYVPDKVRIREQVLFIKAQLEEALAKINEGEQLLKGFKNEFKRYKNITAEVLKSLKKLSMNYIDLAEEFSNKSMVFNFITTTEKINLDYEMKMLKEFTPENITKIVNGMDRYYIYATCRSKNIIEKLNAILEEI